MSDFYQTGLVTTLHRLGPPNAERLERELVRLVRERPVALVLPSLYSELEGPALPHILDELCQVPYLSQVVISLDQADKEQFCHARKFFSRLPQAHRIIWNDGPRIRSLFELLPKHDLSFGEPGKGRGTWVAHGYVLSQGQARVIAIHDCDILSYDREMLARLVYPVVNRQFDYRFCKGYYSRITDRMHGRVTRLMMTPLIRSLERTVGPLPLLSYLDSFRYILAGEFSMDADLPRVNRIPSDWGLEIGVLAEIYRNVAVQRVCQVDLASNYEHKHQPLSEQDPETGLMKMAIDISKSLFRTLAGEGVIMSEGLFKTLVASYKRTAEDTIERYYADAAINGLEFDRDHEEKAVETFTRSIGLAGVSFLEDPLGAPLIPNWNRVTSAIPGFLSSLSEAVEEDNKS
jgi:glucosyl-3-phosphoglycerate synthase